MRSWADYLIEYRDFTLMTQITIASADMNNHVSMSYAWANLNFARPDERFSFIIKFVAHNSWCKDNSRIS